MLSTSSRKPAARLRCEQLEDRSVPSAGSLDPSFGTGGIVTTAFGSETRDTAYGLALQPDGKAVAVGEANGQFALARYGTNGTLDPTFGSGGQVMTNMGSRPAAWDVAIYPNAGTANDGKIVVVGTAGVGRQGNTGFGIARYNPDGSLDKTFNKRGTVTVDLSAGPDSARAVVLQPDGKIVVAGYSTVSGWDSAFTLIRFNVNGTLDKTFGSGGKVVTNVVPNGSVQALTEAIFDLARQADGKLVVAGTAPNPANPDNQCFTLARYNANGSLDTTFGNGGIVSAPTPTTSADRANVVLLQPDGRIVAAGNLDENWFTQGGVMRFNPDGTLDASFGTGGLAVVNFSAGSTDFNSISAATLQPDGEIVVAGGTTITGTGHVAALARIDPDGSLDAGFGTDGVVLTNTGSSNQHFSGVALQADGKIVTAGYVRNGSGNDDDFLVARYLGD